MSEPNSEFPTVIGPDARFKGELTFDKGVCVEGQFEGQIQSKGTLHVAEGASVTASIQAANVKVEGACKGNLNVSEKLHLLATAKVEGDLRTNRLEIADGAIFIGNVVVGQASPEPTVRRPEGANATPTPHSSSPTQRDPLKIGQPPMAPGSSTLPKPRSPEVHVPTGS